MATVERLAYSAAEAADALNVSPRTIERLVKRGALRAVPYLSHIRISVDELERFANEKAS